MIFKKKKKIEEEGEEEEKTAVVNVWKAWVEYKFKTQHLKKKQKQMDKKNRTGLLLQTLGC